MKARRVVPQAQSANDPANVPTYGPPSPSPAVVRRAARLRLEATRPPDRISHPVFLCSMIMDGIVGLGLIGLGLVWLNRGNGNVGLDEFMPILFGMMLLVSVILLRPGRTGAIVFGLVIHVLSMAYFLSLTVVSLIDALFSPFGQGLLTTPCSLFMVGLMMVGQIILSSRQLSMSLRRRVMPSPPEPEDILAEPGWDENKNR